MCHFLILAMFIIALFLSYMEGRESVDSFGTFCYRNKTVQFAVRLMFVILILLWVVTSLIAIPTPFAFFGEIPPNKSWSVVINLIFGPVLVCCGVAFFWLCVLLAAKIADLMKTFLGWLLHGDSSFYHN